MEGRSYKDIINDHAMESNFEPPLYHCQQDSIKLPCKYYCSLLVCGKTFSIATPYATIQIAEMQAAKLACEKLNLISFEEIHHLDRGFYTDNDFNESYTVQRHPYEPKLSATSSHQSVYSVPTNSKKPKMTRDPRSATEIAQYLQTLPTYLETYDDKSKITVSSIEEIWRYMHGDVLAAAFKSLLHLYCQLEQCFLPKYSSYEVKDTANEMVLHNSSVVYKGQTFNSAGPMQNKKQGELSAAEVCLRSLGFLPKVESVDDYTIQPYRGGKVLHSFQKNKNKGNHLMNEILAANRLPHVLSRAKEVRDDDGNVSYLGYIWMDDKIFISEQPSLTTTEAKQKASSLVMRYFNVEVNPKPHYPKFLIVVHDIESFSIHFTGHQSPFANRPSESLGWMNETYPEDPPVINGVQLTEEELKTKMMISLVAGDVDENPYHTFLTQQPTFQCTPLTDLKDLMVCSIDPNNPNKSLVGNKDFSIHMYCEGQKLFAKNRNIPVKLLPGHQICKLECHYILTASNDIYLEGISCYDLYFPNRPQPIVRSCSVVNIMHDPDAGDYPHVMFTRPLSEYGFPAASSTLSKYLSSLISGDKNKTLDILRLVKNIQKWKIRHVELLSQMTMDSMYELFTDFSKYDNRWNEVFMDTLSKDLIELKRCCASELGRRKMKGDFIEEESEWLLYRYNFRPRLLPTGPFIEDSAMCAVRGFRNLTGMRLKLGDFDDMPFVDIPVSDPGSRGAVDRYFIWAKTATVENQDMYYKKLKIDMYDENLWVNMNMKKPSDSPVERLLNKEKSSANQQEPRNQKKVKSAPVPTIKMECRWFPVTTGPTINIYFKQLIESPAFVNAMNEMKKQQTVS